MAGYFEEMGWSELRDGEQPNHLLHMARFLLDVGVYDEDFSGQWPRLPPPASKNAIANLQEFIMENDVKNCPICLKDFNIGEKALEMPCHHLFHAACILTWLERTNSCPFCRHELPTDDEAYEAFKKEKKRAEQRKEDIEILHNSMFS
ncbi:E3 ubiquitin-protein ligase RNF181 [Hyposmocoma kahamanoa]|uniref:E3 ubiquitin-protein ligase RNF181 n=1 Tax=Hyposmocoma kahamanoa TaxID=1477025 RepID=UPI000E6D76F5|nr:E3 ubiquitin-protein ligase RNF181 [Hyposmocoma kahamanoa]XP_026330305.1 E3 ubiquitin-protein ligase RNF181 [Hyposmocoma kahamanoa]XP_026330306.1 E3 ubiquitin-protein ligase RNF181 [Hyposmocoma kahamanoa]XP_026330307.1 E3 ubiquitin-protein ligase RNF181 [Hyposmocoma kahamanoa]